MCGVLSPSPPRQVAFTGSTPVGKMLRRELAGTGTKISLELGGKSPIVVYGNADLDSAVEGIVTAIWFNQGQVCCAGSRLLVQESVAEQFVAKLKRRMSTLRVGQPLEKNMDMGSLVDKAQQARVQSFIDAGREEGADIFQASCPDIEGAPRWCGWLVGWRLSSFWWCSQRGVVVVCRGSLLPTHANHWLAVRVPPGAGGDLRPGACGAGMCGCLGWWLWLCGCGCLWLWLWLRVSVSVCTCG